MPDTLRAVRNTRAAESFVIIPQESGFRVYAASDPSRMYEVRQENGRWRCTCPDFDQCNQDEDWNCEHILAAAPWAANASRQARPNGNTIAMPPAAASAAGADTQPPSAFMLIRRSVSPDGRIDSASVEFTLPVAGDSQGAIKEKALRTLGLQREIVAHFLGGAGTNGTGQTLGVHENGNRSNRPHPDGNCTTPARIIEVGEVQGKWGPRLCLIFQVNGNRARLFGSAKQLAARLGDAGFDYTPAELRSGLRLNLDCLATTQPSDDGKYVNVDKVYPLHQNGGGR